MWRGVGACCWWRGSLSGVLGELIGELVAEAVECRQKGSIGTVELTHVVCRRVSRHPHEIKSAFAKCGLEIAPYTCVNGTRCTGAGATGLEGEEHGKAISADLRILKRWDRHRLQHCPHLCRVD